LALALADVDVAVAVVGAEGSGADRVAADLIRRATDAPIVEVSEAAIVACLEPSEQTLADVSIGTALAPEDGARVGLAVERLTLTPGAGYEPVDPAGDEPVRLAGGDPARLAGGEPVQGTVMALAGPGIPGERVVVVHGIDPAAIAHLGNVNGRFPTGFDTWLFAPGGEVMAISRSTTIRLVAETELGSANDTHGANDTNDTEDTDGSRHRAVLTEQNGRS
jgi:phosphonate C-P lyase system protein PhnH